MSRHLKVLAALMMWVVITAGIAATAPAPVSAEPQPVGVGAENLLNLARLGNRFDLIGASGAPIGASGGVFAASADPTAGDGVENYYEDMEDKVWRPAPRISPPVGAQQIVGLETWLAIDKEAWERTEWTYGDMKYVADPVNTVWTFTDEVIVCEGHGTEYTEGAEGPAPCGRTWTHTTEVAEMTMEVAIEYRVTWTEQLPKDCKSNPGFQGGGGGTTCTGGGDGESGSYMQKGDPLNTYELRIGEIQSIGTALDVDSLAGSETAEDHRADQVAIDSEKGYGDCGAFQVFCDIGDAIKEAIIELTGVLSQVAGFVIQTLMQGISWLRNLLPPWARVILDFLEGCVDQFDQIIQELLTSVVDFISDPVGYLVGLFTDIMLMIEAITKDPLGFVVDFLKEEVRADQAEENLAAWAGGWACEIALDVVAGTTKLQGLTDWLDDLGVPDAPDGPAARPERDSDSSDDSKDDNDPKDNDDSNDDDPDGDLTESCDANSFPTGTLVLMADGSRQRIDLIEPGDLVLAADEATGVWSSRAVIDQWHHLDDGVMATVTLSDGSQVTATDHHQFWVQSDGAWVELDQVKPGDILLTPDGVTEVASVELTDPKRTLVWELDVAIDDTFTVFTGGEDLLVHNRTCWDPNFIPAPPANYTGRPWAQLFPPDGSIPTNRQSPTNFDVWWDDLTAEELAYVLSKSPASTIIGNRIRGRGQHEWCMCSQSLVVKRWGKSMAEIKAFVTSTSLVKGTTPAGVRGVAANQPWAHPSTGGVKNTAASVAFHKELSAAMNGAKNAHEFATVTLPALLARWGVAPNVVPIPNW